MDQKLPEEVWFVGKGPSLDTYDWSKATGPIICVNETAFVVPKCTHAVAIDYSVLDKYQQQLDSKIIVWRKSTHIKYKFDNMFLWSYEVHAPIRVATAVIGLQIIKFLGGNKVHFVGFDSIDGNIDYSSKIKKIGAEGRNNDGYFNINRALLDRVEKLKIEAIWEHRG